MGPGALNDILKGLPNFPNSQLMVGYDTADDACVYRISDDTAVIQTVDFFTPVADDPYLFGQIAAANALSDVYAMGGKPTLAMNLLCVPNCLTPDVVHDILRGGHDKAVEAGCVVAGGHTIEDNEPKYGMCVMGLVRPDRVLRNAGAKPGDMLILTKPIGSGILVTAQKGELASEEEYGAAIETMRRLNKYAGEIVAEYAPQVDACTDVTGFGLLGHSYEMASGSGVTIELYSDRVPLLPGARDYAEMGIIPGGAYRNRDYALPHAAVAEGVPTAMVDLLCDPQTSGGLLVAVRAEAADELLQELRAVEAAAAIVGRVTEAGDKAIRIV